MIFTGDVLITWRMPDVIAAIVRGTSGGIHDVRFAKSMGWVCTCPSDEPECAHIAAVRQLTGVSAQ